MSSWTREQKSIVIAAWLGWTLDYFDFTLMVFVLPDIAREFMTDIPTVTVGLVLTLALRPIGAFVFGRAADRYGRRPALMASVLTFSLLTFASAFSTSLTMLLMLRALFGIAMGGEWGVGASLTMETVPAKARGKVSGTLQTGGPSGFLLASIAYGLLFQHIGWRGMFLLGIVPALLALFIRARTKESPQWQAGASQHDPAPDWMAYGRLALYAAMLWIGIVSIGGESVFGALCIAGSLSGALLLALRDSRAWSELFAVATMLLVDYFTASGILSPLMGAIYNAAAILTGIFLKTHWRIGLYAVLLMTALNLFSHGTGDLYPTFLQVQHRLSPTLVGAMMVIFNIGGIIGSLSFGPLSERIGRRRTLILASLLSLPVVPFFAFGDSPVVLGASAFVMQIALFGTWGVVPAYLNEISPSENRGTFPGFVYQLGNLLASVSARLQSEYAVSHGNDYATTIAVAAIAAALSIVVLAGFGTERRGVPLNTMPQISPEPSARAATGVMT